MTEIDTQNVISLRKQVRLLTIVSFGLGIAVFGLIVGTLRRSPVSASGWPEISAGILQAKRIVLMTDDGKPAAMLSTVSGSAGLVLFDTKGEVRVLLSTGNNRGQIMLSGENAEQSTYIKNGALVIGDEKVGGIAVEGPPAGGPVIRVFDQSGYSTQVGRSVVINHADGTVSVTSAASLMGSSKDKASTWSLLNQPAFTSMPTTDKQGAAAKPAPPKSPAQLGR